MAAADGLQTQIHLLRTQNSSLEVLLCDAQKTELKGPAIATTAQVRAQEQDHEAWDKRGPEASKAQ